jgi:hypothetical protein
MVRSGVVAITSAGVGWAVGMEVGATVDVGSVWELQADENVSIYINVSVTNINLFIRFLTTHPPWKTDNYNYTS